MAVDHFSRVYARQEYLTPGEPETLAFIVDAVRTSGASLVLEVACGKGEAACVLAASAGCRVVAVDRHIPFLALAAEKIAHRGLADKVGLLRADGQHLPAAPAIFAAAYCIGAPSIVGLEPCLRELHRVVRSGGAVIVSDVVWRQQPDGPLGPEWDWIARETERPSAAEYQAMIEACGLDVQGVHIHGRDAWETYFAPMRLVAADERARGEAAFADEVERDVALEGRAADTFLDYATFTARNR